MNHRISGSSQKNYEKYIVDRVVFGGYTHVRGFRGRAGTRRVFRVSED
jgi:hypothetical protein